MLARKQQSNGGGSLCDFLCRLKTTVPVVSF